MRIENENFVVVGSLKTLSLVYMTEYYQKTKWYSHPHIHKVKFYPSADDFTQALLVMLVTNIMSAHPEIDKLGSTSPKAWEIAQRRPPKAPTLRSRAQVKKVWLTGWDGHKVLKDILYVHPLIFSTEMKVVTIVSTDWHASKNWLIGW